MRHLFIFFLLLLFVVVLTACEQEQTEKARKPAKSHYVETAIVEFSSAPLEFIRTGTLTPKKEIDLIAREEGVITELPFFEGDTVKKGELLVRLDDSLLRAELARTTALHTKAKQDLKRARALYKQKVTSEENLNAAQVALKIAKADMRLLKTRLAYTKITAPFDGVISKRLLEPGNLAERYSHLLTLTDPQSLITEVNLSELLLPQIKLNMPVKVNIDALGTQFFSAYVTRIHPSLNPQTRQATIEIELEKGVDGVIPGQLCRVLFQTNQVERLMIPFKALRRDEVSEFVLIVNAENKVERRDITTGVRIKEQVAVIKGLEIGQQVVIKGFLDLKPGKIVKIVNQDFEQIPKSSPIIRESKN